MTQPDSGAASDSGEGPGSGSVADRAGDAKAASHATVAMVGSRLVVAMLGWVGSIIIARTLSPEAWGQYTFVFALLALMAIFTDLGVGRAVLAKLIVEDAKAVAETATSFLVLRIALGAIGYVIALIYVVALQYPGEVIRATALGGLVIIFATPGHACTVILQSRHRLLISAFAESFGQAVQLAVTIVAAIVAPVLLLFVLAPVIKEVIALAIKVARLANGRSDISLSRRVDVGQWRSMLTEALPLAIGFALTIALLRIDMLLLSLMDSIEAVGIYGIGYKFSDIIDTLFLAAAGPIATLLVVAWPNDLAQVRQRTRTAAVIFGVAGASVVAGFWPSADQVVQLLYGERFVVGADAARLLVVGAALMALIILGLYLLASTGFARKYPVVAVGGLVVNVVANLILIPKYSYNGAAIATVITLAITVVAQWIVITRALPIDRLLPTGWLAAIVVVTASVCAVGSMLVSVVAWPVVSAAAVALVAGPGLLVIRRVAADRTEVRETA